jgi:hypothetical protein
VLFGRGGVGTLIPRVVLRFGMSEAWTEHVVGERMRVDQEFTERVRASEFSSQEWSLIMSAVQFTIEDADDPAAAQLVVDEDATNLAAIMPELENIQAQMGALGGAGAGKSDVGGGGGGGSFFDGVKNALGIGGDGGSDDDYAERSAAARSLANEYASELQSHLEAKGRWTEICELAAVTESVEAGDSDERVDDSEE